MLNKDPLVVASAPASEKKKDESTGEYGIRVELLKKYYCCQNKKKEFLPQGKKLCSRTQLNGFRICKNCHKRLQEQNQLVALEQFRRKKISKEKREKERERQREEDRQIEIEREKERQRERENEESEFSEEKNKEPESSRGLTTVRRTKRN